MKPIHLNLASRPYRDYRPVYAVVVVVSLLTAFLMLNNIETYYRYVHETKNTRARIAQLDAQAARERELARALDRRLRNYNLAELDRETRFINAKLSERAFSWSGLLDQLESVLADDVRLVSIAPSFGPNGSVKLALQFQARSSDGMVRTINRMNEDPHFANPFPGTESVLQTGGYGFTLTADYRPDGVPPAQAVTR